MHTPTLTEAVRRELLVRSEVTESTHRFGGVRDELIAAGRAEVHHALPDSGWVTRRVHGPEDVEAVVELFRLAYERAVAARGARDRDRAPEAVTA